MKNSSRATITMFLLVILIGMSTWATGCANQGGPPRKPLPQQQRDNQEIKQLQVSPVFMLTQRAKAAAVTVPGVENSTAVVLDRNISLAIQVHGFDRLRLNKIRGAVHNQVTGLAPGYEVHVTSDKKLFFELQKIEQQIQREGESAYPDLKAKVDKINEQMKG